MRTLLRAAIVVAGRPSLWTTAARELRAFAPRGWWRRPPFLPVPDRELLRFRMVTAYGSPEVRLDAEDLVTWLSWCRSWHQRHGGRGRPRG